MKTLKDYVGKRFLVRETLHLHNYMVRPITCVEDGQEFLIEYTRMDCTDNSMFKLIFGDHVYAFEQDSEDPMCYILVNLYTHRFEKDQEDMETAIGDYEKKKEPITIEYIDREINKLEEAKALLNIRDHLRSFQVELAGDEPASIYAGEIKIEIVDEDLRRRLYYSIDEYIDDLDEKISNFFA